MTEAATAIAIIEPTKPEPLTAFHAMTPERRTLMRQICRAEAVYHNDGSIKYRALTDGEMEMLCEFGIRTGLDPFQKQIYGIILQGQFTLMTGIGGFRAVARRNGLAGIDAPKYGYADEKKTRIHSCEITVYRWSPPDVNGHREKEAYTARCYLDEFRGSTPIWTAKPRHMLAKCTEACAHRMAFTETLGSVYEPAEISPGRAEQVRAVTSAKALLAGETPEPESEPTPEVQDAELEPDPNADPRDSEAP